MVGLNQKDYLCPCKTIYVLQNENLLEKAVPVFVGAVAAFIFSVITLFIANKINTKNSRRQLLGNLSRELKYDLGVISNFVQEAYRNGILFELLSEYDMAVFDDVLNHYAGNGSEPWLRDRLDKLDKKELQQKEVVSSFQFEKDTIENHIRVINDVLSKID